MILLVSGQKNSFGRFLSLFVEDLSYLLYLADLEHRAGADLARRRFRSFCCSLVVVVSR